MAFRGGGLCDDREVRWFRQINPARTRETLMVDRPSRTVTFLFTDIEGSTRRWEREPAAMAAALARHDALLRAAIDAHHGAVFKTVGDAVCAVFPDAVDALGAALAGQRVLAAEIWPGSGPLQVRMALHSGVPEERDADYFGPPLNRVARLLAAGYGGQILLSRATEQLVRDRLPPEGALDDLGEHRLKDLSAPERIFQVVVPDLPSSFPPPRTPEGRLHHLPIPPTALIGRAGEIETATRLLRERDGRLVTLTGPGGAGKTRLSLHLASMFKDEMDQVAFVSLAAVVDPDLVLPAVAAAVGVREESGQALRQTLYDELRSRRCLLVLDNFEQIVTAAPVVADLLASCPGLKILVTTRIRLHLRGEQELPVPPLAVPNPARLPDPEGLLTFDAVRLFVERARAVRPDFELTGENAAAVVEICARLDGLPLAIELAAARIGLLPPRAMAVRLGKRLDLLAGGHRDLPDRQRTMRAAIAWSRDLLTPDEQVAFARLAVFAGGFSLEAAEAVAADDSGMVGDSDMLDVTGSLLEQSLIRSAHLPGDDETRLTMLETIRAFGLECLPTDEVATVRDRHAVYFLALAEEAEPFLEGPRQAEWFDRLEIDHDNLRAALGWVRDGGDRECSLRFGAALWRFWWLRGHLTEGRTQLDAILAISRASATPARATALNGAGVLAEGQGDWERAAALHAESLAISRGLGDVRGISWALNNLGVIALNQGDHQRARDLLEENLAMAREAADQPGIGMALTDLGRVAHLEGDLTRATELYTASLAIFRELRSDSHIARSLNNLGDIALLQGDRERARALLTESLARHRAVGDRQGVAGTLTNLGEVSRRDGDVAHAASCFEESRLLAEETGDRLGAAIALENLGDLSRAGGDHAAAHDHYRAALVRYHTVGDWLGMATSLTGLAAAAAELGGAATAARLLGAAGSIRAAHALPEPEGGDQVETLARDTLGADQFAASRAAGAAVSVDQLIDELRLAV